VVHETGRPWIVMELLDARSLADMIIEDGPVAPRAVAKIGIALLGALEVAHAIGVLHRDVKPANVLICTDGRCVLTDFGVARMPTDVQLTTPGMVLGSPHFISPERAMGQDFGPPSDLFSLGVTLYTAVEGRPPFDKGDPIETMHAVVEDPPAPPARAGALTQVLFGLLEKDPSRRYDVTLSRSMLRELLAGPLASKAAGHLMTDPYAVVPAQRSAWQPPTPAPPPQPSGQIGGRAMLQPGESLTERLRDPQKAPTAPQSPAPVGMQRFDEPTGAGPTAPIPPHAVVQSSARYDAPTGTQPAWEQATWGPRGAKPAGRGAALAESARSAGAQLVTTVKGWPRNIQIAAAAGVAAVVLLGGIVLLSGGGDDDKTPVASGGATTAPAVATFETQQHAERGVSVKVPKGWKKSNGTLFIDYTDPADKGRRVRILIESSKSEPVKFLQSAGNRLRDNVAKNCARPYSQLGLGEVEVAGKPAAELEYTCGSDGDMRHGVWRAVVEGGKAYSFYLTTPEDKFAESKQIFDEMVRTFQLTA
jgi:eukaryotic-like serine/threonine-protein kinase